MIPVQDLFEEARLLDSQDPLAAFRQDFFLPDSSVIYLDGNSLGRLPEKTRQRIAEEIDFRWGNRLIRSWNEQWYHLSAETGDLIAQVVGADRETVIVCDSTSVNLYKLVMAAIKARPGRFTILSDDLNFPSDLYVIQGIIQQLGAGYRLELIHSADGVSVQPEDIGKHLSKDVALVVLSHVAFRSAWMYPMKEVTDLVHHAGALMLWDLSHSAGAVPVGLSESGADLAVGCSYKYLNGGPGAPAWLYIRKDLQEILQSPVQGWFGAADPFEFGLNYQPATGIRRFLAGTPPVLSLAPISIGVDMILRAGMGNIREKSIRQSNWFISKVREHLVPAGFSVESPLNPANRGSHVSLGHEHAREICHQLIQGIPAIIPDFRKPSVIRFGITPLYTSFSDLAHAVIALEKLASASSFTGVPTGDVT